MFEEIKILKAAQHNLKNIDVTLPRNQLERVAERVCESTWPRVRGELRTIKVAQLLPPNGTVYQTSPGNQEALNILKKLKIEPLPEIFGVS